MRAVRAIGHLFADWFAAAWQLLRYAPWLLLPVVLTEGAQHVAEIQLGMFASRDAFTALANDPTRWAFGYAKVAGLLVSMLIVARAVAMGSARAALVAHWPSLGLLSVLIALTFGLDILFKSAAARAIAPDMALQGVNLVLQSALMLPILVCLFQDQLSSLRKAGWWAPAGLLLSGLLGAIAFVPMQLVHGLNHTAALGAPAPLVWALMVFDTLWVGLLALFVGSSLAIGWRRFVPQSSTALAA
jgi:hypothetical protein